MPSCSCNYVKQEFFPTIDICPDCKQIVHGGLEKHRSVCSTKELKELRLKTKQQADRIEEIESSLSTRLRRRIRRFWICC